MAKTIVDEIMRFTVIVNGDSARKELYDLEKQNRDLTASNKLLAAEKKKLREEGQKNTARYKELSREIKDNNITIDANKAKMTLLQKQIGITGLTMRELQQRASQLRLQLRNMVPGSAEYKRYQNDLQKVNTQLAKLRGNAKATESSLSKVANGFNKYAAFGASVIAVGTGIVLSLEKMIDFNSKLADAQSNVQKTTGLSSREVDKLTIKLGRMNTRTSRQELLELAEEAGRLGKKSVKDVLGFVEVANQLKVALGDDLSTEQIREVGKLVSIYKVGAKEGKNFEESMLDLGSSINEVSASGANQADFLVDYLKRQAGVASQTKVAAADNIGYAATFDEIGQSVEVSATAMNKVWVDMFDNTQAYADIAGVSLQKFTNLLNTDANEAMILFLEGLNGNNEGMSVMVDKLKDIEVGGARGTQALAALASSTDLLRERQALANKAQKEGISLTNEYNLKNNNAAAILERLKRNIIGAFANNTVVKGIKTLLGGLEKLTRGTGQHEKAVREERLELFRLQTRLFNVNTTQGERIKLINQLKSDYPALLKNIDADTASNKELRKALADVNDQLINRIVIARQQDKIDEQNEKTADKYEDLIDVQERLVDAMAEVSDNVGGFELDSNKTEYENAIALANKWVEINGKSTSVVKQTSSGYFALKNAINGYSLAQGQFNQAQNDGNKLLEEKNKLMEKLKINTNNNTDADNDGMPKEGDTRVIDGVLYVYRGGQWTKLNTSKPPGDDDPKTNRIDQAKNEADELLQLQRETEDKRLAIIQDAFLREMALNDESQRRKIADLSDKAAELDIAYSKAILSGNTDLASKLQDQYNEVLDQMELEEQLHIQKRTDILESGIATHIDKLKERYQKEESQRLTAHNNELAALGDNEDAKKALQDKFNKDKLEREKSNLIALQTEINNIINTQTFEGFDLDILTDEQLQKIKDNLQSLGLSLSEINVLLAKMRGDSVENELSILGVGGDVDLLGMSGEQWEKMFQRTETWQTGLAKAAMFAQAATEAYGMYHKFASAAEDRKLQKMQQSHDKEVAKQKRLLDNKLISEKQYNDAVEAEEKKLRKKQAEIEYKRAKREKAMNIASIITSTALAVVKALPNIPLSVAVGAIGTANLALALAQPLPAKGYEKGFYDNTVAVRRQQDGKVFNAAYGGESRSGVVDKPTMFLAGEGGKNFPELIISGPDLKQFDPNLKQSLYREIGRVKGYEEGYYKNVEGAPNNDDDRKLKMMMMQVLQENVEILKLIKEEGIEAYVSRNFTNAKRLRDDINRLEKIESKSKINS